MDTDTIYHKIQAVNSDTSLESGVKSVRISIYQALLYYVDGFKKLNELLNNIILDGEGLEGLSNGEFKLLKDFEDTRILLKGYIFNSKLVKLLNEKGIVKFTFKDLKRYLAQYEAMVSDHEDISLSIKMYDELKTYKNLFDAMLQNIVKSLEKIIPSKLLTNDGDIRLKYKEALDCVNKISGLIDINTKTNLESLLKELYKFYLRDKIVIPIID